MSYFGSRLKYLRKQDNITQQELASSLGISKSTVSMYENGNREPDFETLEAISDFFNVPLNTFFLNEKYPSPGVNLDHYLTIALTAVGERIQSRRKALGISAEALASFLHIPPASVYRYENGDAEQFPIDYLVPTAGFLRTTTSYLLGLTDDPDSVIASPFPGSNLTAVEIELLHRYRRAPQEIRTIVDTALSPYGEQSANPASSEQSVG